MKRFFYYFLLTFFTQFLIPNQSSLVAQEDIVFSITKEYSYISVLGLDLNISPDNFLSINKALENFVY